MRRDEKGNGKVRQSDESRVNVSVVLIGRLSSREMRRRVKTVSSALVVALIALIQGKTQTDTKGSEFTLNKMHLYLVSPRPRIHISRRPPLSVSDPVVALLAPP